MANVNTDLVKNKEIGPKIIKYNSTFTIGIQFDFINLQKPYNIKNLI